MLWVTCFVDKFLVMHCNGALSYRQNWHISCFFTGMKKYRILCLDGGGIRGFITARLIERLQQEHPGWLEQVDLIAGTSTGGLLALALASGKSPSEVCELYANAGESIFDDSLLDDLKDLGRLVGADYSSAPLQKELERTFGQLSLAELEKKVAIPAFDLDNQAEDPDKRSWKPKIFHNFIGDDSDGDQNVAKVALYTSAAPTYFPSADGYIDGGVFANNPSLVALAQAIAQDNHHSERAELGEVVLLSIGTGAAKSYIEGETLDWGLTQWGGHLIDLLMDGMAGISDYQCKQLLGERYARLQVALDEPIELDDPNQIHLMDRIASQHHLGEMTEWLQEHWL